MSSLVDISKYPTGYQESPQFGAVSRYYGASPMTRTSDAPARIAPHSPLSRAPLSTLIAFSEIILAALLVAAHWSFFVEHRLYDQLLNFGENYAFVLNAGEARYFLVTALTAFPATLLLVDASLRLWAPAQGTLFQRVSARPRVTALVFALAGVVLAECCARLFGHAQFADDERIYLWEAQNLLHGSFTAVRPEPSEFFHRFFLFMLREPGGRWASIYPPGQPALIALGMLVHAPHLPQLVLVGLTIWTASRLADELWGGETAALTAALVATSPLVVMIGATLHNAVPTMCFALMALRGAFRYRALGRRRDILFVGCASGAALVCRPFDTVLLAMPTVLLLASRLVRRGDARAWRGRAIDVSVGALAAAPFVAFLLLWQRAVTGKALVAPYARFMEHWQGAHAFGFGSSAFGVEHTLPLAFSKSLVVWSRFDTWVFGWPFATLLLVLVLLGLKRDQPACWLLAALAAHAVGYFFYAAPSVHTFGTYYQLPLAPLVALLTARAVLGLRDALRALGETASAVPLRALAVLGIVAAFTFWLPELAYLWRVSDRIEAPLRLAEAEAKKGPIIVFHRAMQPYKEPRFLSWTMWPPLPNADLADRILWAADYGSHNLELVRRAPNHRPFLLKWSSSDYEPVLVPWSIELIPPQKRQLVDSKQVTADDEKRFGLVLAQPNQMVLPDGVGWSPYDWMLSARRIGIERIEQFDSLLCEQRCGAARSGDSSTTK